MLKPSCLMVETYKWNEVLTIMYSMMEKHTFLQIPTCSGERNLCDGPSGQKYNQSNLCYDVLTVCVKFLCTTQHPQYIHIECKQLKPHYVGPLRLSLDHFTPGRESFPRAALNTPRGSPTTPHHLWLHKAGRAPGARPTSLPQIFPEENTSPQARPIRRPTVLRQQQPQPTIHRRLQPHSHSLYSLSSAFYFFSFSFPLVFLASFHSCFWVTVDVHFPHAVSAC